MDVFEAICTRRSVRSYAATSIPPDVLQRLQQAMRAAPSACNFQPWHFIFVTEEKLRHQVALAANEQLWMGDAPLVVVACGLPQQAYKHMAGQGNSVEIDVAVAVDHLTLAAVAVGLGTCWIGAFDEHHIKQLLGVPPAAKVVALSPLGYPASPDLNTPLDDASRKPLAEVFSVNCYAGPHG